MLFCGMRWRIQARVAKLARPLPKRESQTNEEDTACTTRTYVAMKVIGTLH